jgi:hypothetical protein
MSKSTHNMLLLISKIALGTSLLWFAGLIYFSAGWGRLVSPGLVLVLVSPVGVLIGWLLEIFSKKNESIASLLPQNVMTNLAQSINDTYRTAMWAGLGMLVIAGVGKVVTKMRRKKALEA